MVTDYCELHFVSEPGRIRTVVRCLLEFMGGYITDPDLKDDLRLILSELLNNAVVHGNKSDRTKRVYIVAEASDGLLSVRIRDEGVGFDYKNVIKQGHMNEVLCERGRGILLVTALTDKLSFNETGNLIQFEKRL